MAKYIFTQPYIIRTGSTSITSGGTIVKSFNTGDIIEGVKKSMSAGQPGLPPIVSIETVVDGKIYPIADFLVKEYTGDGLPISNNKFEWTPFKKGIAAILAIGTIFGILKLTKVI